MKPGNRSIVEKADIAVSNLQNDGGYLNNMQANAFIRMLIEQPTIVAQIRTVPMNAPVMEINKIGFGSRIMKAAPSSGTALPSGSRSKPTTEQITLTTKEVMCEVHIPYDVLEDNIERGSLEDTIMSLITERASLDIEELVILGDTGSGDTYLALFKGMLAKIDGASDGHVVAYSTPTNISKNVFKAGIKQMPNKYMRNRGQMVFWVSPQAEIEWWDSIADLTSNMGDQKKVTWNVPLPAYGIPVRPAALMPNAQYVLTYPKNCILGVQRQIMIETDRDIRARVLVVVLTMRLAFNYEETDAVVKATGLNPSETTTTTTT